MATMRATVAVTVVPVLRGVLVLCLAWPLGCRAGNVPCDVGARVQGEFGGGEVGTIAEIGTQSPHVGAFRITFAWSPRGEWYHPDTWDVHPAGSRDRCVVAAAGSGAATAVAREGSAPSRSPNEAATSAANNGTSTARCRAGDVVVDRQNRKGTVLGEDNGMCKVRLAGGEVRSYLHWMLSAPAVAGAGTAAGLASGRYTCSADGAGFFRIDIGAGGTYANADGQRGSYVFDAATTKISFPSGSLAGYHAKLLGPGKFGLSERPTTMYYTVCNLQR
ncbi:MAG TPA: hypothetical protein VN581_08075 [Patescibacteria group bacterium]|nr:hypothetical protein [Patescibacteria group bacterium]